MTVYRGYNVWAYFVGAVTIVGAYAAGAVIAGPGKLPLAFDLFALLVVYALVVVCAAAVFEAIRHIEVADGEMDWGEAVATNAPATETEVSALPLRSVKTPA